MRTEFDRMAALMALDDILEVYPVKDEAKQAQRTRRKAHIIAWVVAELAKGPCLQGQREKGPDDDDLFGSSYWQALRVAVLRGYNHECMRCGGYASEVHHIRPRQFGGGDHPRNMMPLCKDCHDEIHCRIDRAFPDVFGKVTGSFVGDHKKTVTLDITTLIPIIK